MEVLRGESKKEEILKRNHGFLFNRILVLLASQKNAPPAGVHTYENTHEEIRSSTSHPQQKQKASRKINASTGEVIPPLRKIQ